MNPLEFMSSGVHICTVAKAATPNFVPVLDRRFATKKVILVHTANFLTEALALEKVFKQYQIKTEFFVISSAFDIERLRTELGRLMLSFGAERPLINISAGTKPISLVLFEHARALDFPVYYMNMDDSISWLSPVVAEKMFMEDRIKLKPFLTAHGIDLVNSFQPSSEPATRNLLEQMVDQIDYFKKAIPKLNYYAQTVKKGSLVSNEILGDLGALADLIVLFEAAGLLQLKNNRLHFKDEEARFFANGGWLEEFLFHQIKQVSSKLPHLQDNLCGVEVLNTLNGVKNEIDNLVLSNNTLFVIECKTKRFKDDGLPDGSAVQSIYKLETIMNALGGPFAKGMVVSIFNITQADKERAEQHNIKIVSFNELKNISKYLLEWFNSPNRW